MSSEEELETLQEQHENLSTSYYEFETTVPTIYSLCFSKAVLGGTVLGGTAGGIAGASKSAEKTQNLSGMWKKASNLQGKHRISLECGNNPPIKAERTVH